MHFSISANIASGILPFILLSILGGFILGGCASKENEIPQEDMAITVDFGEVHLCSRISPEIAVINPPPGTKFYDVRLVEYGDVERFLGGGSWKEDGSGIIPEGVLTRHYTGPCPPANRQTEYAYIVAAMGENNPQPLEVRIFRFNPD